MTHQSYSAYGAGYSSPRRQPKNDREALVAKGLPLVRRLAFRLARRLPASVDVGDLIGAGSEGLLKAVAAYDSSAHPRFEPYAEARIRGAMLDELRAADPVTRHGRRKLAEVTKAIRGLTQELGRPPEEAEIAARLEITIERYRKLAGDIAKMPALGHVGELSPEDLAGQTSAPDENLLEKEKHALVAEAITKLPERLQMVLALYYQEQCTQAEIGEILGVTEGRVCQLLGEAAARIRANLGVATPQKRRRRAKQ